ncbi:Gfo/Idh/MocA family protein [Neptunicella marina]|uniref:Gfo/Idh/MocA family oxidoreductase n=1 Tax=Neptunicella marina TaxID=2125989 RepID=A0A8J6IPD1_9ALTE|nr:Gfo/Idh/MocA family oxidoreductase [Neptunicella marina]MBC3764731.1 Gfo/Idh/MocA family oxidoreductase [Neptunicella marina]
MDKVRLGLIGGGPEAFIGQVHRYAAFMDNQYQLVCGVFSRDQQKNHEAGEQLLDNSSRAYSSIHELIEKESALPEAQRVEVIAIVTPNISHFEFASAAIQAGIHVFCEKPATFTLAQSRQLQQQLEQSPVLFGLAHTYIGYPLVQEARQRVIAGELGDIKKVVVEYSQDWLAAKLNNQDSKQGSWRLDPNMAGVSCCVGDIGVHAANLAEFICDMPITRILADLASVEDNRQLDDDAAILVRFKNNARGVLIASQISVGEENNLSIRVYGSKAGLHWQQQQPNSLRIMPGDQPAQEIRTGFDYLSDEAKRFTRTPAGHPEGYIEAFANLYSAFADAVKRARTHSVKHSNANGVPGITEALAGMQFIESSVKSSQSGNQWLALDTFDPGSNK